MFKRLFKIGYYVSSIVTTARLLRKAVRAVRS